MIALDFYKPVLSMSQSAPWYPVWYRVNLGVQGKSLSDLNSLRLVRGDDFCLTIQLTI